MPSDLRVENRTLADGRNRVGFSGEVDATNVARFRESLAQASSSGRVVADLSNLTYLDSAGVEVLFDVARRCALAVVAGPECVVRHLLDVVALGAVATVLDEAPA